MSRTVAPALARRSILAILYSSLIFGSLAVPYCYIAIGILIHNPITALTTVVLWLAACTSLLLLIFISRSNLEETLTNKLGKYFRPLLIAVVIVAMGISCFIELGVANFALLVSVEYWYNLIMISGVATAFAFVAIILTRPSRLEKSIAFRLSPGNKSHTTYRVIGYLVLAFGLIFVCSKMYEFYFLPITTWH